MTTLKAQLAELREQYDIKRKSSDVETILNKYGKITANFSPLANTATTLAQRFATLSGLPDDVPRDVVLTTDELEKLKAALRYMKDFIKLMAEKSENASEMNELGLTEQAIRGCNTTLAGKIGDTWGAFIAHQVSLSMQEEALLEQPRLLQPDVYARYLDQEKEFREAIKALPDSDIAPQHIMETGKKLAAIKSEMKLDAPDDVMAFFAALNMSQQAPLALLTPTVLEWITAHKMQSKLVVKRKGLHG